MSDTVENITEKIYEKYLKPLLKKDGNGSLYIDAKAFEKIDASESEKKLLRNILKEKKIDIIEMIEPQNRPTRVSDFEYGPISEIKHNSIDIPKFANIKYDANGEIISEDYSKLDEYLEEVFIPKNLEKKTLKKDKYVEPYDSIQLNKIVKEQFSEDEITHIFDYLSKQGIQVRGISEDLEEKFDNYDYHYSIAKHTQTPKRISSEETLKLFEELEKYINEERVVKLRKKIEKSEDETTKNELQKTLEMELKKIKDETKREEIIEKIENGNALLADWVLYKDYMTYGLDFQEWKVIAYEGLFHAIKTFNIEYGYKFSTYAVKVIRNYIYRELEHYYGVSDKYFSWFWYAMKVVENMHNKKYKPGDNEMLEEILNLLVNQGIISIDLKEKYLKKEAYYIGDDEAIYEIIDPTTLDEIITNDELKTVINNVLKTLTSKEEKVIRMRYGLDVDKQSSLDEVAAELGLSRERIRQIEAKATRKLKHYSRCIKLATYVDPESIDRGPSWFTYPDPQIESYSKKQPELDKIKQQLLSSKTYDLKVLENATEENATEPSKIALIIENILSGRTREIPSKLLEILKEKVEKIENQQNKKIVKLRLGLDEYPRPLTYEEIAKIVGQDIEMVKDIMKIELQELITKEIDIDGAQKNQPEKNDMSLSNEQENQSTNFKDNKPFFKVESEQIEQQLINAYEHDLGVIKNEDNEPTELAIMVDVLLRKTKEAMETEKLNQLEQEIENLSGSIKKKIVKLRLGLDEYPRPLTYEEITKVVEQDIAIVKFIMIEALKELKTKNFDSSDIVQENIEAKPLERNENPMPQESEKMPSNPSDYEEQRNINEEPPKNDDNFIKTLRSLRELLKELEKPNKTK